MSQRCSMYGSLLDGGLYTLPMIIGKFLRRCNFAKTASDVVLMSTESIIKSFLMASRTPPYPSCLSFLMISYLSCLVTRLCFSYWVMVLRDWLLLYILQSLCFVNNELL